MKGSNDEEKREWGGIILVIKVSKKVATDTC